MAQAAGKNTATHRTTLCALLLPLLFASACHAQVYKWVDAQGQTHYSERKGGAGGAQTAQVKIPPPPPPSLNTTPSTEYLQAQSKFAPQQRQASVEHTNMPAPSLSDGRDHGTDASRCALARDVLSGAVRHGNGKPTDQYDRGIAKNDIAAFCKTR